MDQPFSRRRDCERRVAPNRKTIVLAKALEDRRFENFTVALVRRADDAGRSRVSPASNRIFAKRIGGKSPHRLIDERLNSIKTHRHDEKCPIPLAL